MAFFVYRLKVATLIRNYLDDPYLKKIEIEILAERPIKRTMKVLS